MGIDDESSHPELCSGVADGVTHNIVRLFREPDAVTPPVRFDKREQETELGQTGLRRAQQKPRPTATGRLKSLRLFSTLPQYRQIPKIRPPSSLAGSLQPRRSRRSPVDHSQNRAHNATTALHPWLLATAHRDR